MKTELLNLLFPNLCFRCHALLPKDRSRLCPYCFEELTLIDPTNRCPFCFEERGENCHIKCSCLNNNTYPFFFANCFDSLPTPHWVSFELENRSEDLLAGISALLQLQLLELHWPKPDLIIPHGGNALSKMVSKNLGTSFLSPFLWYDEKYPLFKFGAKKRLRDKTILILAPLCKTRQALSPLVDKLISGYPKRIYTLTLCGK